MANWMSIKIHANHIKVETARACLIQMPNKSDYADYKFWHPVKCIRKVLRRSDLVEISFTDEWEFRAFKNGSGKTNSREVVDEAELSASEIMEIFENGVEWDGEEIPLVHVPDKIDPVDAKPHEDLIDE